MAQGKRTQFPPEHQTLPLRFSVRFRSLSIMTGFYSLFRSTWILLNGILAVLALGVAVSEVIPGLADGLGGAVFFVFVSSLFALVAAGLRLYIRAMVILPAMALFLSSALFSFSIAVGTPIWGAGQSSLNSILILGSLAVAFVQLVSTFLLRKPHLPRVHES